MNKLKYKLLVICCLLFMGMKAQQKPNIVFIYTDDLGIGDLSCYGATKIATPHIDKLAKEGALFTDAHATSATCTPSRFSLLTGKYAWRKTGTSVAPGNASLIIPTDTKTLPAMLQQAGYNTAVIGKWHLGLGPQPTGPDWNGDIRPGPLEIGFSYSFIIPATGDRVPCVFVENHQVVGNDVHDPIQVSYGKPIGNDPTGREHPELLKMKTSPDHGHDATIVNGISRIGYMSGGTAARWTDEDIADILTNKAVDYINKNKANPFFLYFATHDIHVPRVPHARFAGKSGLGARGDVILELDAAVGQLLRTLDSLGLTKNTLIIFSSDNGPVLDDGYQDEAVTKRNGHTPSGIYRGGKYSNFEAGTRVPFIVKWPGKVKAGSISNVPLSQIDLFASLASLTKQRIKMGEAPDSYDQLQALLGKKTKSRPYIIEHAGSLSIIQDHWKYIEPGNGRAYDSRTDIELGNATVPQLYDLSKDPSEKNNLASLYPEKVKALALLLETIKTAK
jgi:arylsulfatase A-like enzyme